MKQDNLNSILKELVYTPAPSGYEWSLGMAEKIQSLIGFPGLRIGNNLVYEVGQGSKKVFISAHMDEVGFFIKHDKKNDRLYVNPIGYIDASSLAGKKIDIFSFAGNKTQKVDEGTVIPEGDECTFSKVCIKLEKKNTVKTGALATFSKTFVWQDDSIMATSLDNKVGVTTLISLIQLFKEYLPEEFKIIFCFSSAEEQGMNGVMSAVRKYNPDLCIDIDSAYAQPYSDINIDYWTIPEIGKGPALQLMGQEWILSDYLRAFVEKTAEEKGISLQYEIPSGDQGGTQSLFYATAGYPFIQLNIPVADQHTSQSKASLSDIQDTITLAQNVIQSFLLSSNIVTGP